VKEIVVTIADARLSRAMTRAIRGALRAGVGAAEEHAARVGEPRLVCVGARATALRLGKEGLGGALVLVRVTERNARHLEELVEGVRGAGAVAVQLVWDGKAPAARHVERHVFAVLEQARATPGGPPVVLARSEALPFALRILIANRQEKDERP
jgi:hypothetical protein